MDVNITIKEAMSTPVETVNLNTSVYEAANILKNKGIGCLIVVNDLLKPVGIITERDMVAKVVARNLKSKEVLVKEVVSPKLITISPKATLMDAAKTMAEKNIKRLPVIENEELLGIITVSDIASVSPELFDIMIEASRIEDKSYPYSAKPYENIDGICEICGSQGNVRFVNGKYLCDNCIDEGEM